MLSLQSDPRLQQYHNNQQLQQKQQVQLVPYNDDSLSLHSDFGATVAAVSSSALSNLTLSQGLDSHEVDDDTLMALAHQKYKAGNYKHALEHSSAVYERNPHRTDNLLLLGAIHYQLHNYDQCIAKNEEALRIDPHFAECYGNMANAWKEKGNIDTAIRYYLFAIEAAFPGTKKPSSTDERAMTFAFGCQRG